LLQVASGFARIDQRLLELLLLLALRVVGKDRRLLLVFLLHPLEIGALLVDLRASLVELRLETTSGNASLFDFLDGALHVDVPDLHRLGARGGGDGYGSEQGGGGDTAHLKVSDGAKSAQG